MAGTLSGAIRPSPRGVISNLPCTPPFSSLHVPQRPEALPRRGVKLHVAAWPGSEGKAPPAPIPFWERQLLLSRAFASQAGAYVILAGGLCSPEDTPEPYRDWAFPSTGDSCIIDPRGEVIAGPAEGETILYAEGSLENVFAAKVACDVAGHYSRPDIFELKVNRAIPRRVLDTVAPELPFIEF